ncbi:hypothetical protein [Fodinibius halophilus]|uniref:Uncharacterized protein n=1 Tax=Fodinibius halophilus TaxID=1736908 RepID=A0A6M1T241_9BACT|nr:hypothetical protein [Fodinibius halophilus]NGP88059.1 hypothetical protein [Fodinibius halophilus]
MSDRTIKNDLDFAVEYRLVKKSGSGKPFKKLGSHDGAVIPKEDLGHVRLQFRAPKTKDIETVFHNHIQVLSASVIQSQPKHDTYSYHLVICDLNEDWVGSDDEDVELVDPDMPTEDDRS